MCGCFVNLSYFNMYGHDCNVATLCPCCGESVSSGEACLAGGHDWYEDLVNTYDNSFDIAFGDRARFKGVCNQYAEARRLALAGNEDEARMQALLHTICAQILDSMVPKKKKHAPSQKARKIKAKRAAAIHEMHEMQCPPAEVEISPGVFELE
jgi:hypothetical protein